MVLVAQPCALRAKRAQLVSWPAWGQACVYGPCSLTLCFGPRAGSGRQLSLGRAGSSLQAHPARYGV